MLFTSTAMYGQYAQRYLSRYQRGTDVCAGAVPTAVGWVSSNIVAWIKTPRQEDD